MEKLLSVLKTMPEYKGILECIAKSQSAAITGIGQINRSHMIAGLRLHTNRPIIVLTQDDMAAKRLQEELKAFSAQEHPVLPSRELTLYDSAVVSRAWEQKRLRQLYDRSDFLADPFLGGYVPAHHATGRPFQCSILFTNWQRV